jgi:hypothetical protein
MAERFRIDLGFPALYASLSMDTQGITDGVVVYDKERQQLFYTGSYGTGGGGGGTIDTGSFLVTASAILNTITFTQGDGSTFDVTIDTGSGGGGGGGITNIITGDGLTGSLSGTTFTIDVDYYGADNIILEAPNFTPGNESRVSDKLLIYNNNALEVQDITIQQFIDGYNITGGSNYWFLSSNNNITNSGSLNVVISSSLTLVQTSSTEDILTIKRGSETKLKVNNEGVLTLSPNSFFPTAVTGGVIYKDNEYYLGFL